MSKRNNKGVPVAALEHQMDTMRREGYTVFPSSFSEGIQHALSGHNILNFQGSRNENSDPTASAGGFLSTGIAVKVDKDTHGNPIGTPGKGYIPWGANNNLPNVVALANSRLVYTALCTKFNIDVLCGLGVEHTYEYHSTVGCNENESQLSYKHAGDYIQGRIERMRSKMFNLLKEHTATPLETGSSASPAAVPTHFGAEAPASPVVHPSQRPIAPATVPEGSPEGPEEPVDDGQLDVAALHAPDGLGYRRYADGILDDMIRSFRANITRLEKEYKTWARTNSKLQKFDRDHNQASFSHDIATDLVLYNVAFCEVQLSQDATYKKDPSVWTPSITGLRYRDALTCRFEEKDDMGVSRYVYVSNQWLQQPSNEQREDKSMDIAAIPALDPAAPLSDLSARVRNFRSEASSARTRLDNYEKTYDVKVIDGIASGSEGFDPEEYDKLVADAEWYANPANRPCRFILPIVYRTSGRFYYPQPAYWSHFKDIYSYASNIIRDRAIRKQNETMFTYVLYVHQGYLNQLTNQLNAQKTEKEKQAIKAAEIKKIQDFLSNKHNNGSTLAACTFVGQDGKDHDAFRVERINYANDKQHAEADKTEITDMSSLICFAFEVHPDLIGATPGVSSNGGTYQREMLLINQAKKANMQQLMLAPYALYRDFNGLDTRLSHRIKQRVLTTLDASKTGIVDE